MNTNDNILTLMIEKDMKAREIDNYVVKDEIAISPKKIKVGANEIVYICYCYVETTEDFELFCLSGTEAVLYEDRNMGKQELSNTIGYHSSRISTHWSNIKIMTTLTGYYYIRYIRVITNKNQKDEES